jgi:hypothetical protein
MRLFYDRTAIAAVDDALSKYAADEFESLHRSTVPLLSLLEHEQPVVSSLLRDLGIPTGYNLHLEYKVKPPKCNDRASYTDLMVISGESALAVEAKWLEPRYETVGKWLTKGSKPLNRRDVLTGWLSVLQKHAMRELHMEDFSEAVYQMVHRAASACATGKMPKLAYLVFKCPTAEQRRAKKPSIHDDLTNLWNLLGNPKGFPFYLVDVPLSTTPAFEKIAPLPKGHKETVPLVKAALSGSNRLFKFENYLLTRVGEDVTRSTSYTGDQSVKHPGIGVLEESKV